MPRDFLFLNCQDGKHDWRSRGGANAGCSTDCACSVPVHECGGCGDCDYGDNAEARAIIAACWQRNGKPAERMADDELLAEGARREPTDHKLLPWQEQIRWEEITKELTRRGLSLPVAA
jgi:hypothetical protein